MAPEIQITGGICRIDADKLDAIRRRAAREMTTAGDVAFIHFPVDRTRLASDTINAMVTSDLVCATMMPAYANAEAGAIASDRDHYKGGSLTPEEALQKGLVAKRIGMTKSCPAGYDWTRAAEYSGVDSCKKAMDIMGSDGIPTAMYSSALPADRAKGFITSRDNLNLFMNLPGDGKWPIVIKDEGGVTEACHRIIVSPGINVSYALRAVVNGNWSAWSMIRKCPNPEFESNLAFNFGIRVYIPVEVEMDGKAEKRALIISQVAAAAKNPISRVLFRGIAYLHFIAGEFAKALALFLQAG